MFGESPSDIKESMKTKSQRGSKSMYSRVLVDQVRYGAERAMTYTKVITVYVTCAILRMISRAHSLIY